MPHTRAQTTILTPLSRRRTDAPAPTPGSTAPACPLDCPPDSLAPVALRPHVPVLCSGVELRQLRQARGLLQRELAELLGYSVAAVRAWEQGRRHMPASIAPHVYTVLDQVTAHLATERARFLDLLRDAWAG